MSTKDIGIYETGNGGDIAVINNDISLAEQLYQQAYLALSGGNVEADTKGNEPASELRADWWGNALFFGTNPVKQFNSQTERALRNNALNSTGRVNIQQAVESDLAYLKTVANVTVSVSVTGVNKLAILVQLNQPGNQQSVVLQVLWDGAKKEMIITKKI
jgi:hypothetical protein